MLHDDTRGLVELLHEPLRRVQIHQIVVGKFLALQLLGAGESGRDPAGRHIERGLLVRVFAVAHGLAALERDVDALGQRRARAQRKRVFHSGQPLKFCGDHTVVTRSGGIGFAREVQTRGQRKLLAIRFQFFGDGVVVRRIGDHRHAFKILCGRTHHSRPADINVLDQFARREAGARSSGFEGIQIHHHQINRRDAVLLHGLLIARFAAAIQDSAVHLGMQRLHAPAEHFRPPGKFRNIAHRVA